MHGSSRKDETAAGCRGTPDAADDIAFRGMQFRRDGTIVSEEELGGTPGNPEASHYAPEVVFESDSPLRMRSRLRSLGEVFLVASPPPPPLVAPFRFPSQAFLLGHPFPSIIAASWLRFTGGLSFRLVAFSFTRSS
ncbi:hypothetical protein MTO96_038567 [Rhipicephalus appendiculatus]